MAGREARISGPVVVGSLLLAVALFPGSARSADEPPPDDRSIAATAASGERADAAASPAGAEPRPAMRQLESGSRSGRVPSARDIAAVRPLVKRRFYEAFSHTETALGAQTAAETLLSAATNEGDGTLRWVLLDEARRLGEDCGQAGIVSRSFALAAGFYDVDDVAGELRSLRHFPIRILDPQRAAALARSAEHLAVRAAETGRVREAVAAEDLATRAWQRAGNIEAARAAAARGAGPAKRP